MQAQLPPEHISHDSLADMLVGDLRYTVPWAMHVDENWDCWLNVSFVADPHPHGTASLPVRRDSHGFVVALSSDHRWRAEERDRRGQWEPVAGIVSLAEIAPR